MPRAVGATPSLFEFDSVSLLLDRSGRCAQEMAATACSRIKQASAERVPVCCVHTVQDANSIAGSSTSPTVFHGFMLDTWKNLSTCVATAREVHNDMYVCQRTIGTNLWPRRRLPPVWVKDLEDLHARQP